MLHPYNLLTLRRLKRYAEELDFKVPKDTVERLWEVAYFGRREGEKIELLSGAGLASDDVPAKFHKHTL